MGKLKYPLGILLTMIIGALLNMLLCCNCWGDNNDAVSSTNDNEISSEVEKSQEVNLPDISNSYLLLKDAGGNTITSAQEHLNFNLSDYSHLEPVDASAASSYEKIKSFLDDNPDKKLTITGLYASEEENNSAFTNLGEARANDVKNYLAGLGYDTTHMGINGLLSDQVYFKDGIVYGPLNYSISDLPTGESAIAQEKALDDLATDLKANPLILQFATGASTINLTAEQREKVSKLVQYLDARPSSGLTSIGHTDNTGARATNISISAKRAEFAKSYLVKNGISASRISTDGKGPDEPIASNTTEEGKSQNRRVVVTLK